MTERFKIEDAGSYDSLASEFDQFGEIRAPVIETMFARVDLSKWRNLLDVGTGTGIVAIEAAKRLGPDAKVFGIDLSDGLLSRARQKTRKDARVSLARMDAEVLAFKGESFDAVLSLYALLHFPNPEVALSEMFRVLRPGGRAMIAIGSGPQWLSLQGIRHGIGRLPDLGQFARGRLLLAPRFLERLVQEMYPWSAGDEETELAQHSNVRRGSQALSLIRNAGFVAVNSYWQCYQHTFDDPDSFWLLQRVYSSFSRKRLNALPSVDENAVKREFLDRARRVLARGGKLVYPYAALFVSGQKP
jgi:SAM-dependent methyltransferase